MQLRTMDNEIERRDRQQKKLKKICIAIEKTIVNLIKIQCIFSDSAKFHVHPLYKH